MIELFDQKKAIESLRAILGGKYTITTKWRKQAHTKGWRYERAMLLWLLNQVL